MFRRVSFVLLIVGLLIPAIPAVAEDDLGLEYQSSATAQLQQALKNKGFYRGPIDGSYGAMTQQAVMAFRKEIGASRSFSWSNSHWDELNNYVRPWTPYRLNEPDRIEVNLSRQVIYLFKGGGLVGVFPISSGNGQPYENSFGTFVNAYTPTGDFRITRHIVGERISYLGTLWNPWYFKGGFAIHGSPSVPGYPASHGCIRLTFWDSDFLENQLYVGMPVHIWYQPSGTGPTLAPGGDLGIGGSAGCPDGKCDSVAFNDRHGRFYLWDGIGHTPSITPVWYGVPGDVPFSGDWDGDGVKTLGLYRRSDGYVYLRNSNTQGVADISYYLGIAGDLPVAGDFDGDGRDTVSIYRPSEQRFYIINEVGSADRGLGVAEYSFPFGAPGDVPFSGDFDGNGIDTVGLHRPSDGKTYLKYSNTGGFADNEFVFGIPGDKMIAGDWNGDGFDTVAVYRPRYGVFYVKNTNSLGMADGAFDVGYFSSVVPLSN